MEVIYNNKTPVQNGEYLQVFETQSPPQIKAPFDMNPYVVVMYDPDAVKGTYLHWIKGEHRDFLSYKGPAPPPNSGEHHYVFEFYMKPNDFHPHVEERKRTIGTSIEKAKLAWGLRGDPLYSVSFIVTSPTMGGKKMKRCKTNMKRCKTKMKRCKKKTETKNKKQLIRWKAKTQKKSKNIVRQITFQIYR
jgi:hypothetical protein